MSMRKSLTILFIITISFCVFAQGKTYLISINLDEQKDLNRLDKFKLPVYHIGDNILFTEVSDKQLKDFEMRQISFKIIDENPEASKYFFSIPKNKNAGGVIYSENVIYNDGKNIIYKNIGYSTRNNLSEHNFFVEIKKKPFYFENVRILPSFNTSAVQDSLIRDIVSEVNPDSVRYIIQNLQNFQTRFLLSDKRDSVANWIRNRFIEIGYTDVKIDSFYEANVWNKNVVATLPALNNSEQNIVVGGHHDSYSSGNPMVFAPGADDNASGTAAVLEMARVLKRKGYNAETNIRFVTFAAEEYGLYGGFDYAGKAYSNGMKIKLMINHDMISTNPGQVSGSSVNIDYYTGSLDFRAMAILNTNKFTKLKAQIGGQNISGSDSYAFWSYGYPAVYFEEFNFSPVYHSPNDIIANCNIDYCAEVIKGSCATLLFADKSPSKVENFSIVDLGTGNSLKLSWRPVLESDIAGYHLQIGRSSGIYDTSITLKDTALILNNLKNGIKYYFGISTFDQEGNESVISEKWFTPLLVPLAPYGLEDFPQMHAIRLNWSSNKEHDILGYDISRTEFGKEEWIKLNADIVKDTFYLDSHPLNGIYYLYSVAAVDSALNSSEGSIVKSRALSLDQGILVIDETSDGDGTIFKPNDFEVDNFFDEILSEFNSKDFDVVSDGIPKLADLGAYSTIIWHGNDNSDLSVDSETKEKVKSDLKKYLLGGGRFIYAGYSPSKLFENNTESERDFSSGSFIYDILKIKYTKKVFGSRFNSAISIKGGYPSIFVDSLKIGSSTNFHLKNIESIEPNSMGQIIYKSNSNYDTTVAAGKMNGAPVGIEYIGSDYKTITLSFPLYYMNLGQAKELLQNILIDKFNEVTSVENGKVENYPDSYALEQNYPNPFNPSTVISYRVPVNSQVTLNVYDILGNEVATLVNGEKPEGSYDVEFNATALPSGVYFYKLQSGSFKLIKKMILLK